MAQVMRRKILWFAGIFLVGGAISTLLALNGKQAEENPDANELRQVITYQIELQEIPRSVKGQGFVQSAEQLRLISQVNGEVLFSLEDLKEGVSFEEGDLLLQIDSSSIDSQVQLAETALLKSLSSLISSLSTQDSQNLKNKWETARSNLLREGALRELPEIQSERERLFVSQYGVLDSYYQLKELRRNQDRHRIAAPFTGLVQSGNHPAGSMIFQGQEIALLINPVRLETAVSLTLEEAEYLKNSAIPSVRIYPSGNNDFWLPGSISRFSGFLNGGSQTLKVFIEFENTPGYTPLLPGSYADIRIAGDPVPRSFTVPRELLNGDGSLNFLVEGRLKKIPVQVEGYSDDRVIVTGKELHSGMELILTRLQVPLEGMELERLDRAEEL